VHGFDLRDTWAFLRYGPAFATGPCLRLRPEWTDLDPHQKTVLSDDMGVAMSTYLLATQCRCTEFVDTAYALNAMWPSGSRFAVARRSKQGPAKLPDYIAKRRGERFVVLECKGTQVSRSKLQGALAGGRGQKTNLVPEAGTKVDACLVGGVFVPQWESSEEAEARFEDPDWEQVTAALDEAPRGLASLAIEQIALAKVLSLGGMAGAAGWLATTPSQDIGDGEPLKRLLQASTGGRATVVGSAPSSTGIAPRFEADLRELVENLMSHRLDDWLGERATDEEAPIQVEPSGDNAGTAGELASFELYGAKFTLEPGFVQG
jgi:hypothetical protein